ncbi:uncharacterized protein LOC114520088 [Dendronephthya gigantea]|uniref:uncharacterized protein LOC114520088 n=1 Tax=Dendronephthya gigantea TaxID=151771 RepID=UPI00106CABB4|nr:uncharacterized protein LOC114520088 [Dendronephthya gigantea]
MADRTTVLLFLFLVALLFILWFMPTSRPAPEGTKLDPNVGKELNRFQETIKKFVNSMGEMEKRLDNLEVNVQNIQKKQESFQVNSVNPQISKRQSQEPVNHDAEKEPVDHDTEKEQKSEAPDFIGEIRRNNNCFDSAEHGFDGAIEVFECHKQGRNQEFQLYGNKIRHKQWCLVAEKAEEGQAVLLGNCGDNNPLQKWQYQDKLIKSAEMNFCMRNKFGRGVVSLAECNTEDDSQKWDLEKKYGT